MKKKILFGAGKYGRAAVKYYGRENIKCFVDNNSVKWNTYVEGIPVINIRQFEEINRDAEYEIIITTRYYQNIEEQLIGLGVHDYKFYSVNNEKKYYPARELVLNPYENDYNNQLTEQEYNEVTQKTPLKEIIRTSVDRLYKDVPLFDHIEIETINRCNGICSFCPINAKVDPRKKQTMTVELFEKIINELADLEYNGRIALFSNNEPMLDDRIIDMYKYCRSKLPDAWLFMFTNGTLLTLEKCKKLLPLLDELIIDNYSQDLKLIPNSQEIVKYCEENKSLCDKVTIVLRKPDEILSSRGGDAPNRKEMISYGDATCVLPFRQMIVRPDGKVSLCCNDPLGKNTLGDLASESLTEVWYGEKFQKVREALYIGRDHWKHCTYCDTFNMG